jgi:hypothetical protein
MSDVGMRLALVLVVIVGLLAAMTASGQAQFVLYDDFAGPRIDPERWYGGANEGNSNNPAAERIRVIDNGQLHFALTSYGNLLSNSGFSSSGNFLNIAQLGTPGGTGSITGMQARVTMLDAKYKSCPANTAFKSVWAIMGGFFFNDGSSTGASDQTGNVNANIFVQLHPNGGERKISYNAYRCLTVNCSSVENFPGGGASFTTGWDFDVPVTLKLVWQPANKRFRFNVNGAEVKDLGYTLSDTAGPVNDNKFIGVSNFVHNCTAGRKRGEVEAVFDQVKVNRQP